jgi:hypothetical protein
VSVLSSIREKLDNLLDEFSWYPFNHFHNDLDPAWPCLSCTNVTAAPNHYDAVVRTLDTFPLVRPFSPISYKNISDSSLWRSDEHLRPSLPFAARILDRVVAEMYLGVERFVEWHFDSFLVTLLWNAAEVSCDFVMETIVLYMVYFDSEENSCQQIAFYFIVVIGMVGPLSCCKLQPFESCRVYYCQSILQYNLVIY